MVALLLGSIALLLVIPLFASFSYASTRYLKNSQNEIAEAARLNVVSARRVTEMFQSTVTQAATQVLMADAISATGAIATLDATRASFDAYRTIDDAVTLLTSMTYFTSLRIDSVYFYADGADYILTSDSGAVRIERFEDTGAFDVFNELLEHPQRSIWTVRDVPVRTIAGDAYRDVRYLTYANMANPVVSKVRGAIFVNIRETVLSDLVNASDFDRNGYTFIVGPAGTILSHVNKDRIYDRVLDDPGIGPLIGPFGGRTAISTAADESGSALLVASYSPQNEWTFVSAHSLSRLLHDTRRLLASLMILAAAIVTIGSTILIWLTVRISTPLRELLASMKQAGLGEQRSFRGANEFEYLLESFETIRDREASLRRQLDEGRDRVREADLMRLLHGDADVTSTHPFSDFVPSAAARYRVAVLEFDDASRFNERFSEEQRIYYRSLLARECERLYRTLGTTAAVVIDGAVAVIVQVTDDTAFEGFAAIARAIQGRFRILTGFTITVGIGSGSISGSGAVTEEYREAGQAVRRRLVSGPGEIHEFNGAEASEYDYPYASEARLINALRAGEPRAADHALDEIFGRFASMHADDIVHAANQLCGVVVGFARENNYRRILHTTVDPYTLLASRETLAGKREVIEDLCSAIVRETSSGVAELVDRILEYIRANHASVVDFEEMASEIGVSYSYMRKVIRDNTGKSLLDHLHYVRIERAEIELANEDANITDIARELGYNNLQSFERFFKRHKGISAKDFRKILRTRA